MGLKELHEVGAGVAFLSPKFVSVSLIQHRQVSIWQSSPLEKVATSANRFPFGLAK
jgi:hypothetical protein